VRCPENPNPDGGHWMLRSLYVPDILLNYLQLMTNAFVEMAVHPDHVELRERGERGQQQQQYANRVRTTGIGLGRPISIYQQQPIIQEHTWTFPYWCAMEQRDAIIPVDVLWRQHSRYPHRLRI
jgi:hypothetical protein